ncbi:methyl-accepting chemotaxis sensory transducer [Thalassoporum mexicanum PCC 7367]|uniref:methyl-accepting chemotaxis protein n=1 Tax=Thalassoporum mexicanum TaxID=3457544 RepID=UPI00029FB446|nr:CHASE3 domain-containing protein [Pseudanabaena sp. PCC 7367]AFY71598.1 methyl-accepting chemotaxis sensory transducer [Pseudanabaena sp. PCC 7367]
MQQGLRINQFVLGGFGIVVLIAGIASFVSQSTTNSLEESNEWVIHTYQVETQLRALEKLLVDAETGQRGFVITGKEQYLQPYNAARDVLDDEVSSLRDKISDNPAQVARLDAVVDLIDQKLAELAETIALKRVGQEEEMLAIILSDQGKIFQDQIIEGLEEMIQIEAELLEERNQRRQEIVALSRLMNWGSFLAVLAIAAIISLIIIRIIGRNLSLSLKNAFNVADKVAAGDLTPQVETTASDEIGKLMAALGSMIEQLNSLVAQVQRSGIQVTTSSTQIAASGKQLEATMTEQIAATNETASTAMEIAVTSQELVQTMESVVTLLQNTTDAAAGSQTDLARMESTMSQLVQATNSIAAKLGAISEKANNINNVVVTITKVADQTNLLSLNAAIEAEKAGEYGAGFAVVAREIRRLADQTAVATLDIEQLVKDMQSSVSTGVMEMDKFSTEVAQSVGDVQNVSFQVAGIIAQVQDLGPRFESVNQGMENQAEGAQQIGDAMSQLRDTSEQTTGSLRGINLAIADLNNAAQGLQQEISRFKIKS